MSLLDKGGSDAGGGDAGKKLPGDNKPAGDGGASGAGAGSDGNQRPAYVPEKFWKDGKADLEGLGKAYSDIETWKGKKVEELVAEARAADRKDRNVPEKPEAYTLPKLEGTDPELMAKDPMVAAWRGIAHQAGLGEKEFQAGIESYVKAALAAQPDYEAELKLLGDNANARIGAIKVWAEKNFSPEEFAAIKGIATSAAGIKALEKMQKMTFGENRDVDTDGDGGAKDEQLTPEKLKGMQSDPRYWDPSRRDPAFVKQVDEGFKALYDKKK